MAISCSTCEKKLSLFYLGVLKPWYTCDVCGLYHCHDCATQLSPEVESARASGRSSRGLAHGIRV